MYNIFLAEHFIRSTRYFNLCDDLRDGFDLEHDNSDELITLYVCIPTWKRV